MRQDKTTVLITGGLGFIGSHTVVECIQEGFQVIIIDDCSNASVQVLDAIETITSVRPMFYQGSVLDRERLDSIFSNHSISGVIHFAAFKSVNESVKEPLKYYENNVVGTISLLQTMQHHSVNRFIFSSSATVYSSLNQPPFTEAMTMDSTHAYGLSKIIIEQMLTSMSPELTSIRLRYFNPVGAHPSYLIGENPKDTPNNLFPIINRVAIGQREELLIYGSDYPTKDGTAERDYIHVMDVARAHVLALKKLDSMKGSIAINIGTGQATSVMEVVNQYQKVNGIKVKSNLSARREGDVAVSYANVDKALQVLGFETKLTMTEMVRDSYLFMRNSQL